MCFTFFSQLLTDSHGIMSCPVPDWYQECSAGAEDVRFCKRNLLDERSGDVPLCLIIDKIAGWCWNISQAVSKIKSFLLRQDPRKVQLHTRLIRLQL